MNARLARSVGAHTLGWLVAANSVGLLMAVLVLWPELNRVLEPLTYGRWAALHLDWELYGSCALPLVGALCAWLVAPGDERAVGWARGGLIAWSLALAAGGMSWLGGLSSGKVFLDWHGWARPLFPFALLILWGALARGLSGRKLELSTRNWYARAAVLAVLIAVPPVIYWAAGRSVYPSFNPDSGGATGTSLLGSTLLIVAIAGWIPYGLGLARTSIGSSAGRLYWGALAVSACLYASLNHGNVSHHSWAQIASLGALLVWGPLSAAFYRTFDWPRAARPWLIAALLWWVLLLVSGWWTFLPGNSERFKFTDLLVAHAHVAMAGAVTSMGLAILVALGRPPGGGRLAFWGWQVGLCGHIIALVVLAIGESRDLGGYFGGDAWVTRGLMGRLAFGAVMWAASLLWLRKPVA